MLPLALFSTKEPDDERRKLADAILKSKPAHLPMRAPQFRYGTGFGKPKFPTLSTTTSLAVLVNPNCWLGMHKMKINPVFLPLDVGDWAANEAFQMGLLNVRAINVVNDCTERGVKLISDFVATAKNEEHLQNMLQTVKYDRYERQNLGHYKCE